MYEKLMYKVKGRNNKVIYRLQDFTKNDNVNEDMFEEGRNAKGETRLQCQVHVLHLEEFEALQHKQTAMKEHVETLSNKIKEQHDEIKRLKGELAKHERADIDRDMQLQAEKFNMLQDYTDKVQTLENEHQCELDELKETYENQLLNVDKTHRETLEKTRLEYNDKVNELNDRLLNTIKANDTARDKLHGEMLQLKETHKDELVNLQSQHHNEVEKLQHAHGNELQDIREAHEYDITQLKQSIAVIKQEHLVEVHEIEQTHLHEVDDIRTKFVKLLASEHAKDLSDFNACGDLPFYIKPFAKGFLKAFDEFKKRKELNTPQTIVETYEHEKKRIE